MEGGSSSAKKSEGNGPATKTPRQNKKRSGAANQPRPTRQGPPEDGVESLTTLYIANLPFDYTSEQVIGIYNHLTL